MDYLLDTHTLLWFLDGSNDLSPTSRKIIEEKNSVVLVSLVSIWEITIKQSLGKLVLNFDFLELKNKLDENDFQFLPIDYEHITRLSVLPMNHRDPFDRLLISQAITENLVLISKDSVFSSYQDLSLFGSFSSHLACNSCKIFNQQASMIS